ncbi:unnamed protein product [Symbiodinium necroappetens]|uniref:Uncharacterized protein n=1 Tax=Symbiodinium necroappetens TaxID=1628268 RepID=A0A813C047_9DINO|nr:unnamed protein product [Symbiodinium necroappetens]
MCRQHRDNLAWTMVRMAVFGITTASYGEREGTVEQLAVGLGVRAPRDAAAVECEAAIAKNDYTSHKESHSFDRCGHLTTETFTSSDTTDKSTEVLGVKLDGTTETSRKEATINTEQTEGTFISSTKRTTTEEEIHVKEHHKILSDDIEILHESRLEVEEFEYQLTQAGFAGRAFLTKPAMALYSTWLMVNSARRRCQRLLCRRWQRLQPWQVSARLWARKTPLWQWS